MSTSNGHTNILRLVGKKGCYEILSYLNKKEKARFSEIKKASGISCLATLSHALKQLHKAKLICRKTHNIPGESLVGFYVIHDRGRAVLRLVEQLKEIGETSA